MLRLRQLFNITLLLYLTTITRAVNCPHNCQCLWVLDSLTVNCAYKELNKQPYFADFPIEHLDLSHNEFKKFPKQLANIETLGFLDLSYNQIRHLEADALVGFEELRTLLLAHNNFNNWLDLNPSVAFLSATSLSYLSLSGNSLETFNGATYESTINSVTIRELELNDCGITTIGKVHSMSGLMSLERLALSGNPITTITPMPTWTVRTLELSNCSLQHIPKELIESFRNLQTLNISCNFALEMKDALMSKTLLTLDVSFCNLDTINLNGFPNLRHALLRGNMLRQLDRYTFVNNTNLEILDLARNSLRNIQYYAFDELKNLTTLDLSYNEIAHLDFDMFSANDALVSVDLSRNAIEKFERLESKSIREINFSGCEMITMDSYALSRLTAIQRLNLSSTLIKELPHMYSATLQSLDLSNCKLSAISNTTFSGFSELVWLYLNGNRLTNPIPPHNFYWNGYLDAVWIGDNPWICNCNDLTYKEFYHYLIELPRKLKDAANVRCASPAHFYGKTWEDACPNAWMPQPDSTQNSLDSNPAAIIRTTIISLILMIGVLTFATVCLHKYLKRRKRQRDRREYQQNRGEMLEIRAQTERMLEESSMPNAPSAYQNNLPSYEDALRMRPVKSMVDLTENGQANRAKLRRTQTCHEGEIVHADLLLDDIQRFRSEEMLSNRDKERTALIMPLQAHTGHVEYNKSRGRRLGVEDARFPAAHMKSQNLQSAEKIGNFQNYEHSPYTKRRPYVSFIPPFRRARVHRNSVEFLTDPEYEDHSKPGSPFARRKPGLPAGVANAAAYVPLAPAVEDYYGSVERRRNTSSEDSDFDVVNKPEIASIPERHVTSSDESSAGGSGGGGYTGGGDDSGGGGYTGGGDDSGGGGGYDSGGGGDSINLEHGRRKKRRSSISRRASAASFGASSSSSSDRDPIIIVHKPMRETLF